MAHVIRSQVSIKMTGGLPEDDITNTWYCDGGILGNTAFDVAFSFHTKLADFYHNIDSYYPSTVAPNAHVKHYDVAADPHSPPVYEADFALLVGGFASQPAEVAAVLSFEATEDPELPIRNRRGRIYLGPLSVNVTTVVGGKAMLPAGFITDVLIGAQDLMDAADDASAWSVYSPTWHHGRPATGGGRPGGPGPLPLVVPHSLDEATCDVTKAWVDNAFDTQRRRGPKATSRTVVTKA